MQVPLQISFRNLESSPAAESLIRERVEELEKFFDRITACRVVIEAPHRSRHPQPVYHVRVDLSVPGRDIVVRREPKDHHAKEDVYMAIRDAFDTTLRQLQDHVRERRGDVKAHSSGSRGRILKIDAKKGYGFISAEGGEEIYFHRNSLVDVEFRALSVGDEVRFVAQEKESASGPQASTVMRVGKRKITKK